MELRLKKIPNIGEKGRYVFIKKTSTKCPFPSLNDQVIVFKRLATTSILFYALYSLLFTSHIFLPLHTFSPFS